MKNLFIPILVFICFSCQNKTKPTPEEFLSINNISESQYTKDSIALEHLIMNDVLENKGSYYPNEYDSETKIIIDSILYSSDYSKCAIFAIDKVENKKLYLNYSKELVDSLHESAGILPFEGYNYNSKVHFGIRVNKQIRIIRADIYHFGGYEDVSALRKLLREVYFEQYSSFRASGCEFNLNDKRFWDNPNAWE